MNHYFSDDCLPISKIRGLSKSKVKKIVEARKEKFINMAKRGLCKPSVRSKVGRILRHYLKNDLYFRKEIEKYPEWASVFERAKNRRELLIEMAIDNLSKPSVDSAIGRTLRNCTTRSNKLYRPKFDKIIRRIRPDWFINPNVEKNKQITLGLIQLAKSGGDRPNNDTELGLALYNKLRIRGKFYEFIKKNRPDWVKEFISWEELLEQVAQTSFRRTIKDYYINKKYNWPSDPKSKYKQFKNWPNFWRSVAKAELYQMVRNNKDEPQEDSDLGKYLRGFTNPISIYYDMKFANFIKNSKWR